MVVRRGSTREVFPAIRSACTALDYARQRYPWHRGGFSRSGRISLNELYLIVHAVDSRLPSGACVPSPPGARTGVAQRRDFRREAGYLGLGQEIPADCSVNVYFLADLESILKRFGNRGYRVAQLEAAIMGGKFIWLLMPSASAPRD